MGMMQLLSDAAYAQLMEQAVQFARGRGQVLAGVGDTSWSRTRDRIHCVTRWDVDAVVILTPYLFPYNQAELVDYFRTLAKESSKPVYLYDLPGLTGVKLELDTVLKLADEPNILGIKCSGEFDWTRQLMAAVDDSFRVIVAQPHLVDVLLRSGVSEHLDGVFALAPEWTVQIGRSAQAGDWEGSRRWQLKLSSLLNRLRACAPVMSGATAILNARGIPGNVAPRPFRQWPEEERRNFLALPAVAELIDPKLH